MGLSVNSELGTFLGFIWWGHTQWRGCYALSAKDRKRSSPIFSRGHRSHKLYAKRALHSGSPVATVLRKFFVKFYF